MSTMPKGRKAVPASRPRTASDLATTVMASLAIALPLMIYLRQHVDILRYGYEIEALKSRRTELVERSRELAVQRAAAESLPQVERRAAALSLQAPRPEDVLVATGDATAAAAAAPVTARLE